MKKLTSLLLVLCCACYFCACSGEEIVKNDFMFKHYELNDKITLQSVNGGSKTLVRTQNGFVVENEEDKIVLIDLFGTFCAPCKEEASELTKLWRNNNKDLLIIGLTHFEDVSDEMVKKFADDYKAYYFLSNSKDNDKIIAQILSDIDYKHMEQLPFKIMLKNGVYQDLSDYYNESKMVKFYLGKVPTSLMQADIQRIKEK
ncbi:TlpA family protein disulfide reductase [Campylobacter sp. LR264d]|uniref:TlpA disulfide reductase family protein n=1 Tax=Campylobacter sp. LR264d TaxID=2593544 RepID=UPI00123AC3AF|nr:TlpA disulfide reductase family protein [Campylobacter sp. LR264d]KAA6229452.1 TlpA family protein disulfide reductase [Campylobacter sp. LR264d]